MTDIQKQLAEALEKAQDALSLTLNPAGAWPASVKAIQVESLKVVNAALAAYKASQDAPRQQEARGPLTKQQIKDAIENAGLWSEDYTGWHQIEELVRATEAAHGIKGA